MLPNTQHIVHPIAPLFDAQSKVLILGSFPSVKSREAMFFYGHPQNRFWRVIAALTDSPLPVSIEEKTDLILSNRLALWDSIGSCTITASSDRTIRDVVPNDLRRITDHAPISHIFCNGSASLRCFKRYIAPSLNLHARGLPSSSPANAAWSLPRLTEAWSIILPYLCD